MSIKKFYKINDLLIFGLIFSFYNDGYLFINFGDKILKIIFLIFLIFYTSKMIQFLKTMTSRIEKLFFIFFLLLIISDLIHSIIFGVNENIINVFFQILAMISIVIYFSNYRLDKILYFIWLSMVVSILICYFNEPLSEWSFRKSGGTGDPNEFATQVLSFMFISIYLFKNNHSRIFIFSSSVLFIYGLFMAGSKSSFLILGILIIIIVLRNYQSFLNYKSFVLILILLFAFNAINFNNIKMINNMLERSKKSGTEYTRINSWIAGYHMLEDNVILGVGINNYADYTRQYAEVFLADDAIAPHNVFVKLVAESGIIVFLSFIIFIVILMLSNIRSILLSRYEYLWYATLSTILMGLTLGITYEKYFWISIAIMMQINKLINNKQSYKK